MPVYELREPAVDENGEKREFTIIPEDTVLEARVAEIKEIIKPFTDDEGNEIKRLEWAFVVTAGEFEKRRLWGETGVKFVRHPDCKLFAWTQGAMGIELPEDFKAVDTDQLVGLNVRVVAGTKTYTKKGATEPTTVNNAKDVFAAKVSAAAGFDPF